VILLSKPVVAAPASNALSFDGVSAYAATPTLTLGAPSVVSMSCWLNLPAAAQGSSLPHLLSYITTAYLSGFRGLVNRPAAAETTLILYAAAAGLNIQYHFPMLATAVWLHLVDVWDGNAIALQRYLNGVLTAPTSTSGSITSSFTFADYPLDVMNFNAANFTAGSLARVALWTTGLAAADVASLYNGANPTTIAGGARYYWTCDSASPMPNLGSGGTAALTPTGTSVVAGPPVTFS
jgi:hypothetical protein